MPLIGLQLRASKQERKSALKRAMYYVSQDAQTVYTGSERQYTAAGEI